MILPQRTQSYCRKHSLILLFLPEFFLSLSLFWFWSSAKHWFSSRVVYPLNIHFVTGWKPRVAANSPPFHIVFIGSCKRSSVLRPRVLSLKIMAVSIGCLNPHWRYLTESEILAHISYLNFLDVDMCGLT